MFHMGTGQRTWLAMAVATGLVMAGCGEDGDEPASSTTSSSTTSTTLDPSTPVALESSAGAPPELRAGLVTSPEGSDVVVTFEVPAGWYGSGGTEGFGIGKGLDEEIEDFADVGVFLHILDLSVDEAVQGFSQLEGLEAQAPEPATVDGRPGKSVEVAITADRVILEPIGIRADIPQGPAVVTFVDVDGQTVMISVQRWKSDADRAEAVAVVDSFDFAEA
jgi:hypothetical protein